MKKKNRNHSTEAEDLPAQANNVVRDVLLLKKIKKKPLLHHHHLLLLFPQLPAATATLMSKGPCRVFFSLSNGTMLE